MFLQTSKLDTLLEGHTSLVTCAKFCPKNESIIVSISEDRTFKVLTVELPFDVVVFDNFSATVIITSCYIYIVTRANSEKHWIMNYAKTDSLTVQEISFDVSIQYWVMFNMHISIVSNLLYRERTLHEWLSPHIFFKECIFSKHLITVLYLFTVTLIHGSYFVTVNYYALKVWDIEQSCLLYQSAILSGRVILPKLSNFKLRVTGCIEAWNNILRQRETY